MKRMGQQKVRRVLGSTGISINREKLEGDKELSNEAPGFQVLDPGTTNRAVVLPKEPETGKWFVIKNLNPKDYALNIKENINSFPIMKLSVAAGKVQIFLIYDGVEWHGWG